MRRSTILRWMAVLAATLAPWAAHGAPVAGLTTANFVDVADAMTDILDTSNLAYSTVMLGSAASPDMRARPAGTRPSGRAPDGRSVESACPGGGSVKVGLWDADGSGDLSTGDRVVNIFSSCAVESAVLAGRSEFVVAAHRYEGVVEVTELEFRFEHLGTAAMRWTGPARAVLRTDQRLGTEQHVVTYRDLEVARGSRRMRWNFSLDMKRPPIGRMVASVAGALSVGDLRLRLRQDELFVIADDGFPRSGLLTAVDERGARLQLEAGRQRYAYRLFLAANGGEVPDSSSQSKPYGRR